VALSTADSEEELIQIIWDELERGIYGCFHDSWKLYHAVFALVFSSWLTLSSVELPRVDLHPHTWRRLEKKLEIVFCTADRSHGTKPLLCWRNIAASRYTLTGVFLVLFFSSRFTAARVIRVSDLFASFLPPPSQRDGCLFSTMMKVSFLLHRGTRPWL